MWCPWPYGQTMCQALWCGGRRRCSRMEQWFEARVMQRRSEYCDYVALRSSRLVVLLVSNTEGGNRAEITVVTETELVTQIWKQRTWKSMPITILLLPIMELLPDLCCHFGFSYHRRLPPSVLVTGCPITPGSQSQLFTVFTPLLHDSGFKSLLHSRKPSSSSTSKSLAHVLSLWPRTPHKK